MTIETASKRLSELREQFADAAARRWDGDTVCPTCGQDFPEDMIEESRARFEAETQTALDRINEQGERLKAQLEAAQEEQKNAKIEATRLKKELLDAEEAVKNAAFVDTAPSAEYTARLAELKEACEQTAAEIDRLQKMENESRSEIAADIRQTQEQIAELERVAQIPARNAQIEARMGELNERQRELADMLADCDRMTDDAERFSREKCRILQSLIDSMFRSVSWRLWREQINGGMTDCCDALIGGVPFEDANNAAKINAGMEIIAALSAHFGQDMPVIVDNAEAVTALNTTGGQVIRLIVSEPDKELRADVG